VASIILLSFAFAQDAEAAKGIEISDSSSPLEQPEPPGETQPSDLTTPVLNSAELISGNYNLAWTLPPSSLETPDGGYDVFIDGVDTNEEHRTTRMQTQIDNLDTSIEYCFSIEPRWKQVGHDFPVSNEICVLPQESTIPPQGETQPPEPTPEPEGFDRFGIVHIYPTAERVFESHWDQGGSRTIHGQDRDNVDPDLRVAGRNPELVIHGDGTATLQGNDKSERANPRVYVYPEDRSVLWLNTEVTVYMQRLFEVRELSHAGLHIYTRSEHQDSTAEPEKGQSYAGRFTYDARVQFTKEIVHGDAYENGDSKSFDWNTSDGTMPFNTWIGAKMVTYDLPNGDVKLELYMDLTDGADGGTWIQTNEFIDDGTWEGRIFQDPSTSVFLRADGMGAVKYKNFSVREIIPPN